MIHDPKEYKISIQTDDVRAAIAQLTSALYELTEEALQMHADHEAEECEFELFARDLLGVLARHADQLVEPQNALGDGFHEVDAEEMVEQ